MTYAPHRRWSTFHARDVRTITRIVAELHRPRLPWELPLTDDERRDLEQRADALDLADAVAEERRRVDSPLVRVPNPTDAQVLARRFEDWQRNERHREAWIAAGQWEAEDEEQHAATAEELRAAGMLKRAAVAAGEAA